VRPSQNIFPLFFSDVSSAHITQQKIPAQKIGPQLMPQPPVPPSPASQAHTAPSSAAKSRTPQPTRLVNGHTSGAGKPFAPTTQPQLALTSPWELWVARAAFALAIGGICYAIAPLGRGAAAAGAGFLIALVVLIAELRLRHASLSGLIGTVIGSLAGMFAALLLTLIISGTPQSPATKYFLEITALLTLTYLGAACGFHCGCKWNWSRDNAADATGATAVPASTKLLDTSVLIDGRIAEICQANFLDGVLVVPQFVLHELQLVADSSDPLKRQRGRRGLEVLQRIQKMPMVEVRVVDDDFPNTADVDHKLIELARISGAKIVTNDFNLNKVATVQGFCVLNVNELANALKPAVLPGETMHVLIQREGKEALQGVAYLNDGTMVVVDGARRLINKTIDIIVTSVHQTTAGKMIFGRVDERPDSNGSSAPLARAAAAGRGVNSSAAQPFNPSSLPQAQLSTASPATNGRDEEKRPVDGQLDPNPQ
jgi:uncharacterized protein YacL